MARLIGTLLARTPLTHQLVLYLSQQTTQIFLEGLIELPLHQQVGPLRQMAASTRAINSLTGLVAY